MSERKLQGGCGERHLELVAHPFHRGDAIDHGVRSRPIIVIGPTAAPHACRQDFGIVGAADHDLHASLQTQRQQGRKRALVQQGVAPGEQDDVKIAAFSASTDTSHSLTPSPM